MAHARGLDVMNFQPSSPPPPPPIPLPPHCIITGSPGTKSAFNGPGLGISRSLVLGVEGGDK